MDYYEILGLEKNATQQDIKTAYRKLAATYHPDVNQAANASAFFRLIQEAYETLYDEDKRREYDNPSSNPPPFQEQDAYQAYHQTNYQWEAEPESGSGFQTADMIPVRRIGVFFLLLPFKMVAAVLWVLSQFLYCISFILASIAHLAGGIIMFLSVVCAITSMFERMDMRLLLSFAACAFVGFLVATLGTAIPVFFKLLSTGLSSFIKYMPVKYVART